MTRASTGLLALVLSGGLALTACAGDDPARRGQPRPTPPTTSTTPPPVAPTTRGIDVRAYYRDYTSPAYEDSTSLVGASATSPMASSGGLRGTLSSEQDGAFPPLTEPERTPGLLEDDTFVEAGTSGFVETAQDAESTFGLDVDTGSFGVARTLIAQGQRPPAASVRPEEWVNAQRYAGVRSPTDGDLAVTTASGMAPTLADGTQLVRVSVAARDVTAADRPPVNVTLVVDRSGSMDIRNRLGLVQSSLAVLADRLRDDDTISVVSFEDDARPVLPPTPVGDTETILDAIDQLTPGGSTNLAAGLELGYRQAREDFEPGGLNLVVLCSDGVANVGPDQPGSVLDQIEQGAGDDIHLVTVGFGMGNYNDHLMEQLADRGDGFYSYVDTPAEAERLFGDELTTTLVPVAAEARSQVAFDPSRVASYRLIGYDNRVIADEDYEDLGVDAGELGAGHRATALYEVRLADGVRPGEVIGTAGTRWRSVADGSAQQTSSDVLAADPTVALDDDTALAAAAADLAQVVKGRGPLADRGVTAADVRDRLQALVDDGTAPAAPLLRLAERYAALARR